jgi:hypothetical protein
MNHLTEPNAVYCLDFRPWPTAGLMMDRPLPYASQRNVKALRSEVVKRSTSSVPLPGLNLFNANFDNHELENE